MDTRVHGQSHFVKNRGEKPTTQRPANYGTSTAPLALPLKPLDLVPESVVPLAFPRQKTPRQVGPPPTPFGVNR